MNDYVLGVDFGTDSVRTILVDSSDGRQLASSLFHYPRWKEKRFCDPSEQRFRQHPLDYIEGLKATIKDCIDQAGPAAATYIRAISVDTTGSTPVLTNRQGTPLALLPGFEENPNAMFVLWKDHTAIAEATEINEHAKDFDTDYLRFAGGIYSAEWFWAKLLHLLRADEEMCQAAFSFVEHCDWIPFLLTGGDDVLQIRRGVCAAGHKALWSEAFGGLPPADFFNSLDPLLRDFSTRLHKATHTCAEAAGRISAHWASELGLPGDVIIGIGGFDAHMGAVGGQIEPYYLSKVMGTSTCDILVVPEADIDNRTVRGICGQVNGSVIPGMIGLEAGQSAFGDAYAWFAGMLSWPITHLLKNAVLPDQQVVETLINEALDRMIPELSRLAAEIPVKEDTEMAIDWFNGRRTPDANQLLKGAIYGLDLGTDAPAIFRAIAEATCFGAKAIVERFRSEGIPVRGLIGMGGVAKKSPFIMQMMADVMNMPIRVHRSEQTCAAGAAMFAATAAGIYPDVETAMNAMGRGFEKEYFPDKAKSGLYSVRYKRYLAQAASLEAATMNAVTAWPERVSE